MNQSNSSYHCLKVEADSADLGAKTPYFNNFLEKHTNLITRNYTAPYSNRGTIPDLITRFIIPEDLRANNYNLYLKPTSPGASNKKQERHRELGEQLRNGSLNTFACKELGKGGILEGWSKVPVVIEEYDTRTKRSRITLKFIKLQFRCQEFSGVLVPFHLCDALDGPPPPPPSPLLRLYP